MRSDCNLQQNSHTHRNLKNERKISKNLSRGEARKARKKQINEQEKGVYE